MNIQVIQKFKIIGISLRINNANGQSLLEVETLWDKFWSENIQGLIPNKINDNIYAVYTNYKTDSNGPYTLIIGLPVSTLQNIPTGFVGITIEKDRYKKFISKGKMPNAVLATWKEIGQNSHLNRAYNTDFTVHGKKYYDGDNAEVETYISVNKQ